MSEDLVRPYQLFIPDNEIDDLHQRLERTRWPDEINDASSGYGVRMDYMGELVRYWRDAFNWREAENRINSLPQFITTIDGLDLHFVHCRSAHAEATPLLIVHGWPGSIVEFMELIPRLTQPELFGGSATDAFHVIAPSLQGYFASAPATTAGMSPLAIAERHVVLMSRLGYSRYVAQGGDWGSVVSHHTAVIDSSHCVGLHLNLLAPIPPKDIADPVALLREHESTWLAATARHAQQGTGYFQIQSTRPQTLAYGLTDSAIGWCAWVAEKFHAWTDCEREGKRDIRNAVSWDAMLTNISLYWFTKTIASSIRLYREHALAEERAEPPGGCTVATGIAVYPAELFRSPRAWAEYRYPILHWYEAPRGGHFAAMEQPALFAADLRRFVDALRASKGGN